METQKSKSIDIHTYFKPDFGTVYTSIYPEKIFSKNLTFTVNVWANLPN